MTVYQTCQATAAAGAHQPVVHNEHRDNIGWDKLTVLTPTLHMHALCRQPSLHMHVVYWYCCRVSTYFTV